MIYSTSHRFIDFYDPPTHQWVIIFDHKPSLLDRLMFDAFIETMQEHLSNFPNINTHQLCIYLRATLPRFFQPQVLIGVYVTRTNMNGDYEQDEWILL